MLLIDSLHKEQHIWEITCYVGFAVSLILHYGHRQTGGRLPTRLLQWPAQVCHLVANPRSDFSNKSRPVHDRSCGTLHLIGDEAESVFQPKVSVPGYIPPIETSL
jgi:hypothetical protein